MAKVKNDVWVPMDFDKFCKLPSTKRDVKHLKQMMREYDNDLKFGTQTKLFENEHSINS